MDLGHSSELDRRKQGMPLKYSICMLGPHQGMLTIKTSNPVKWLEFRQNRQLSYDPNYINTVFQYVQHFPTDAEMIILAQKHTDQTPNQYFDQYIPLIPSIQLYETCMQVTQTKISRSCLGRCGLSPLQSRVFQQYFINDHQQNEGEAFLVFLAANFVTIEIDVEELNWPQEFRDIVRKLSEKNAAYTCQRRYAYRKLFLDNDNPAQLKFVQEINTDVPNLRQLQDLARLEDLVFSDSNQRYFRILSALEQIAFSFPSQTTFLWVITLLQKLGKFTEDSLQFSHEQQVISKLDGDERLIRYYNERLSSAIVKINQWQIKDQFPIALVEGNLSAAPGLLRQHFVDVGKQILFDHSKLAVYDSLFETTQISSASIAVQYLHKNRVELEKDQNQRDMVVQQLLNQFGVLGQIRFINVLNQLGLVDVQTGGVVYKQLNGIFEDINTLFGQVENDNRRIQRFFDTQHLNDFVSVGLLFINALNRDGKKYQFVIDKMIKVLTQDQLFLQENTDILYKHTDTKMSNEKKQDILQTMQVLVNKLTNVNNQFSRKQKIDQVIYKFLTQNEFIKLYSQQTEESGIRLISTEELRGVFDNMQAGTQINQTLSQQGDIQFSNKTFGTQNAPNFILSQIEQKWVKNDSIAVKAADRYYPKANRYESEGVGIVVQKKNQSIVRWARRELGEIML